MEDLYCKQCKEIRIKSIGKGASISMTGITLECKKCGSNLVTKDKLNTINKESES